MEQKITSPVMRYHGAKFRLADWIMSFFPEHKFYVEPFGGSAAVLLKKERSYSEVYNDIDDEVVNVFRVLKEKTKQQELIRLMQLTPFSRSEFFDSYNMTGTDIERACKTIFRSFAGFGSGSISQKTGFKTDSKRSYSLTSHVWEKHHKNVPAFVERFQGVIIENLPAIKVMQMHDCEETLHYVDPPYLKDTRTSRGDVYRHEMSHAEHEELLQCLIDLKGFVVLSGYMHELYDEALMRHGWSRHEKKAQISGQKGGATRTECIWINPRTIEQQAQQQLFV